MDQNPEMGKTKRIASLIALSLYNDLSETEKVELDRWISESDENRRVFIEATDKERLQEGLDFLDEVNIPQKLKDVKLKGNLKFTKPDEQITFATTSVNGSATKKATGSVFKMGMVRWAVAASLLVAVSLTVLLLTRKTADQEILPGGYKATVTLHDGKTIEVHTSTDGPLATQGSSTLEKTNNQLTYRSIPGAKGEPLFNIITTPVTGKYPITLSDGTIIWLNAASAIRVPVAFNGNEREVDLLSGEAYFIVAKDKNKPFKVKLSGRGTTVEVLGTQFNINAYPEQDSAKITLVEGEIKITTDKNDESTILKPQQEARVPDSGGIQLINKANTQTVTAWKDGLFRFDDMDIPSVMKQIERWYDVEVVFEAEIPTTTTLQGTINRNATLSSVVETLKSNGVNCRIAGRKIMVKAL
jgi:transmembrane sensor